MGGDVQLMVTPIEDYLIPELMRLRISFTSEEEERNGVIRNMTSIAAFMNAERIFYQIPSSEVPFQRFRIQVAQLVEGITGPLVPSDLDSAPINGEFLCSVNVMMCRLCSLHVWSRCVLAVYISRICGRYSGHWTSSMETLAMIFTPMTHRSPEEVYIMLSLLLLGECRTLWGEREQAACILATEERMRYQKLLSVSQCL